MIKVSLGVDHVSAVGLDGSHAPDKEKAFGEPVERHLGQKSTNCYRYFTEDRPTQPAMKSAKYSTTEKKAKTTQ